MGKLGVAGFAILALILFFILVPWHNAHEPIPAGTERPGLLATWWKLGQPTPPSDEQAVPVARPAAPAVQVATPVAPKPVSTTAKVQGSTKTPIAAKKPQPSHSSDSKPQYMSFEQAMRNAANR